MNKETAIETTWDLKSIIDIPEEEYIQLPPKKPEAYKMEIIFETVLSNFPDITKEMVVESTRLRHIVEARRLIIFFAKEFTSMTLINIAGYFKSKIEGEYLDHSTIIHSIEKVRELTDTYKSYNAEVEKIRKQLSNLI